MPWFVPALIGAGGFGLSLFGQRARRRQAQQMAKMIADMQNPQRIMNESNLLYQGMLQGPAFSQAQGDILSGARAAQQQLASRASLGSGVTGGINEMKMAMGQSLPGFGMGQLRSNFFNQAMQTVLQNIRDRVGLSMSQMGQPSGFENSLGSLYAALGPLLQQWMASQGMGGMSSGPIRQAPGYNPWQLAP